MNQTFLSDGTYRTAMITAVIISVTGNTLSFEKYGAAGWSVTGHVLKSDQIKNRSTAICSLSRDEVTFQLSAVINL